MVAPVDLFAPQRCPRLVVKIGSSLLVTPEGQVRRQWLEGLVAELAARRSAGQQILVVSSGAIALGARRLHMPKGGRASLEDAQASAAVGQIELAQVYAELFAAHGIQAAQLLLTLQDLEDRRRYLNVRATAGRLVEAGAIPIINENDTVTTAEIRFGDNDRLAARVGQAVEAGGVILLSDIDGLFTGDPKRDPTARLIPVVPQLTPEIEVMAGGVGASGMGSGGMVSKLQAARIASSGGCHMAIISGKVDQPLTRFEVEGIGTVFPAPESAPAARKRWLAGRLKVAGRLVIDDGAVEALLHGRSLLPAGVRAVEGPFERGDVVDITALNGRVVARGLSSYHAGEAARLCGRKSHEIEAILGYAPRAALVHRDDMVIL
ncbi:glutamate 5-kinase [Pedomonas mirosovicensis]|uniref:glutamate 5-kinase n=1 Tax=Pedomonas mirosovicensis TaxID=2908641 RepID=UPI002169CE0A|nr:glutamate 5-kinase [Pedomonas mirosovicensis]MCH8684545.1 glutamate 5-kinase [Pedomonas mirosovicensis]